MPKTWLFVLSLTTVSLTALVTYFLNSSLSNKSVSKNEIDTAVNQAKFLYSQEKERGRDFSQGPCLSEALMPNWVADIAHNPRQSIDDLPQNQCLSYREGRVQHFVELDSEGNLIRAQ
ncbi:hypothetical protein HYW43_01115 [Candidatus Daviesbacteria bacterium]|nr:hypothetical protein [Candidatus Daviesbacteria bacterium]